MAARVAHNHKVAGSSPAPATISILTTVSGVFFYADFNLIYQNILSIVLDEGEFNMSEDGQSNQQPSVPETVPEASVQDRIVDLAMDITDKQGKDDISGQLSSAVFYVTPHETGDGKYPSLKINIPKEEVSDSYQWRAELTFGNQDPRLSTHVLIRKDGTIIAEDYANGAPQTLTDHQAESCLAHLEEIKDGLIQDA